MDPDANLARLLALAASLQTECDDGAEMIDAADVSAMCELVIAIDSWIASGGFLPAAWRAKP